jgi:hypothetical protein
LYWLRTRGTRESRGWKYANVGCEQQPREWNSDCTIFFFFRFRWFAFSFSRRLGNRPPTVKAENDDWHGRMKREWDNYGHRSSVKLSQQSNWKAVERESHNKLKAQIWGLVYQEKSSNVRPPPFSIDCR